MKTIPFNYEQFKSGAKVVTRGGTPVIQIFRFESVDLSFPISALIGAQVLRFTDAGREWCGTDSPNDLFLIQPTRWINLYQDEDNPRRFRSGFEYETKERAEMLRYSDAIATIEIPWKGDDNSPVELGKKTALRADRNLLRRAVRNTTSVKAG